MRTAQIMRQTLAVVLILATAGIAQAGLLIEQVSSIGAGLGKPVRVTATSSGWAATYTRDDKAIIFDANGNKLRAIANLHSPLAIAYQSPDSLFIGEQNPSRVSVWKASDGTLVRSFGTDLSKPSDIVITTTKVYVLDSAACVVKVYDMSGNSLQSIGNAAQLMHPTTLSLDTRTNTLFIGELTTGIIHVYDLNGTWKRDIGWFGSLEGAFARLDGVAWSDLGLAIASDPFLSRIQAIDANGNYKAQVGAFGSAAGQVKTPLDVAMGSGQSFAIADFGNDRLDVFRLSFDSAADASSLPDGVFVNLKGPVVTAGTQDFGTTIYVQRQDRASGIRVDNVTGQIARGAIVSISGTTATSNGQRKITATSISPTGSAPLPRTLGLTGAQLGGTSPANTPVINGANGLYNVGLLVRVWGKVKRLNGSDFYISDGSPKETWIHTNAISPLPTVGSFVAVTGVCAVALDTGGAIRPQVIPRTSTDIKRM